VRSGLVDLRLLEPGGSKQAALRYINPDARWTRYSMTGQVLGEWIDRRVGGGSIEAGVQWKWGDAENAIDAWETQAAGRLYAWTQGTAQP
jgi:hypothetical protein